MAKGQDAATVPPDRLDAYDRLIATLPGIERKGATLPYTSVNGRMFSFLSRPGRSTVRLSRVDREAFIERHATRLHEAHGTVMKEYVTVPDALLADTGSLSRVFAADSRTWRPSSRNPRVAESSDQARPSRIRASSLGRLRNGEWPPTSSIASTPSRSRAAIRTHSGLIARSSRQTIETLDVRPRAQRRDFVQDPV